MKKRWPYDWQNKNLTFDADMNDTRPDYSRYVRLNVIKHLTTDLQTMEKPTTTLGWRHALLVLPAIIGLGVLVWRALH